MDAQESPASNHETGSLTQQSPHESRFIGSSSGIFFINTVKQAFESSGQQETRGHLPAAEDTVGGEDDFAPSARNSPERGHGYEVSVHSQRGIEVRSIGSLGSLPSYEDAQQYAIAYFKTWHPVLPFLSGPEFLQELEVFYNGNLHTTTRMPLDRHQQCYLVIIQCVLAMGAFTSGSSLPLSAGLPSKSHLLSLVAALASRHDILTIQTVLVAQLYCVSTMALRTASSLGGLLTKLLFHAGLHRCPYRYPQLSNEDRELRKRILWSTYAMDRYVCQALGIPISLADSEVDVCVPGRKERHTAALSEAERAKLSGAGNGISDDVDSSISRELILANFVEHAGLVGRALELFHASIHSRNKDPRKVLFLRGDVDRWFNNLPEEPKLGSESTAAEEQIARFLPFFHVLYEQLIISINRPSLSLPRSAPEFHHGLQTTIRAAKRTIIALERQDHLFWPGYLAAVWMSGLIISFACQVGLYNISQGSHEILRCLALLKRMGDRWLSAQRCHTALSTLLSDLTYNQHQATVATPDSDPILRFSKRRRLDSSTTDTSSLATGSMIPPSEEHAAFSMQPQDGLASSTPVSWNKFTEWDVNDFFQDLSWNNLFDTADMAQESELPFYTG